MTLIATAHPPGERPKNTRPMPPSPSTPSTANLPSWRGSAPPRGLSCPYVIASYRGFGRNTRGMPAEVAWPTPTCASGTCIAGPGHNEINVAAMGLSRARPTLAWERAGRPGGHRSGCADPLRRGDDRRGVGDRVAEAAEVDPVELLHVQAGGPVVALSRRGLDEQALASCGEREPVVGAAVGQAGEDRRADWELLGQVDRGRIGGRRVHGDGDGHALDLAAGKCDVGQGTDVGAAQARAGFEAARHRQPRAEGHLVGHGVADAYR